jgi:type I restriction enzyme S subunit
MKSQVPILQNIKIINQSVSPFEGYKTYVATGDLATEISDKTEFVTFLDKPSRAQLITQKGDLVLARMKATNKVLLIDDISSNYIYSTGFIVLRPNSEINHNYLYHFLKSDIFQNEKDKLCTGATQKAINNQNFEKLTIPLPPLPIQKRIADILDAADALRKKDEALLKKYDELAQAIFIDMFGDPVKNEKGWEVKFLDELCLEIIDCPHSTPIHIQGSSPYPCIRTSEMDNGRIKWSSMKYLNEDQYLIRTKRLRPIEGDIVYAREGSFGEAVILPKDYSFALGQRTMLFRPNSKICESFFLWFQINSDFVYNQALKKTSGSTVGHINVADIKKYKILVPPIDDQVEFQKAMKVLQLLMEPAEKSVTQSSYLFESLIQKAFYGELVV